MDRNTIDQLVEQRMRQMTEEQDRLIEAWNPFINAVDEYLEETESRKMSCYERRNVAQCLENALCESGLKSRNRLFEATTEDNISFLGIQLPVIAALLPSLILNDIAIVQALDRRIGAVFYLDVQYGSDKGGISAGSNMMDARTGHDRSETGRNYASTRVIAEAITLSAGLGDTTHTCAYAPGVNVDNGVTVIRDADGNAIATDRASAGTLAAVSGYDTSGTITTAGLLTLTKGAGTWDSDGLTIDYEYQYDKPVDAFGNYDGVPQADVNVSQEAIRAIDFPIRSKYSVGASIDLQKAHGINLENEIVKFLGGEVRFSIDHYGVDLIDDASINGYYDTVAQVTRTPADPVTEWDASVGSGQEWLWKKHEFLDRIEEGNNNIIVKTLRGMASFIVAGNNVARVIKQLPQFQGVANLNKTPPTGPYKIGTLDGRTIIHDPLLLNRTIDGSTVTGANRYIMGWRGDNFLMAGMIYAPYIPLFATPTLVTSDLFAQKGFLSSAGFKIINAGMYTYGTITNLGS